MEQQLTTIRKKTGSAIQPGRKEGRWPSHSVATDTYPLTCDLSGAEGARTVPASSANGMKRQHLYKIILHGFKKLIKL